MRDVERGKRLIQILAIVVDESGVLQSQEAGHGRIVVQYLRPRICRQHLQSALITLAELCLQSMIGRVRLRSPLMGDAGELRKRPQQLSARRSARTQRRRSRENAEERIVYDVVEPVA